MLKPISHRDFVRRLRKLDFVGPYSGGRHLFMQKDALILHIPNPHRGEISRSLLREILQQAEISLVEWNGCE